MRPSGDPRRLARRHGAFRLTSTCSTLIRLHGKFQGPPLGSLWQGVLFLGTLVAFALAAMPLGLRRAAQLSQPPTSRRALRLTCMTVGFGLLLALISYSQSFDWAVPLWEHLPPLRAVQFPFRLLTFVASGLALAAAVPLSKLWTHAPPLLDLGGTSP